VRPFLNCEMPHSSSPWRANHTSIGHVTSRRIHPPRNSVRVYRLTFPSNFSFVNGFRMGLNREIYRYEFCVVRTNGVQDHQTLIFLKCMMRSYLINAMECIPNVSSSALQPKVRVVNCAQSSIESIGGSVSQLKGVFNIR
jgi:hypothetical protein